MKHIALILALLASPACAETSDVDEGLSLLERGAEMLLRGLLEEVEPALDDLQDLAEELEPQLREFTSQMGPALAELLDKVDDLTNYGPPQILPNGDILIPRLDDAPAYDPDGEVEL